MSNKVEGEAGHLTHSYMFCAHTCVYTCTHLCHMCTYTITSPKREKEVKEKRQREGCQHPCLALTIGVAGQVSSTGLPVWTTLLSSGHAEAKDR